MKPPADPVIDLDDHWRGDNQRLMCTLDPGPRARAQSAARPVSLPGNLDAYVNVQYPGGDSGPRVRRGDTAAGRVSDRRGRRAHGRDAAHPPLLRGEGPAAAPLAHGRR